jgi:ribosomal protein S27E
MQVDHLIPKYLVGVELDAALGVHGLPRTFDIHAEDNLVPSCGACNARKGKRLPPSAPGISLLLAEAAQKADKIRGRVAGTVSRKRAERLIGELLTADLGEPEVLEAMRAGVAELGELVKFVAPSVDGLRLAPHVGIQLGPGDAWSITQFTGFGDCPNDNCYTGDIDWRTYVSGGMAVDAGTCNTCGTVAVRCPDCGAERGLFFDDVACAGCENEFSIVYDKDAIEIDSVEVIRDNDQRSGLGRSADR